MNNEATDWLSEWLTDNNYKARFVAGQTLWIKDDNAN
jgi:hypothetical protein